MGRGRQKAKQTKLGREMKYNQVEPDFAALSAELQSKADDQKRPTDTASQEGTNDDSDGVSRQ
jgi:hypothetical protein